MKKQLIILFGICILVLVSFNTFAYDDEFDYTTTTLDTNCTFRDPPNDIYNLYDKDLNSEGITAYPFASACGDCYLILSFEEEKDIQYIGMNGTKDGSGNVAPFDLSFFVNNISVGHTSYDGGSEIDIGFLTGGITGKTYKFELSNQSGDGNFITDEFFAYGSNTTGEPAGTEPSLTLNWNLTNGTSFNENNLFVNLSASIVNNSDQYNCSIYTDGDLNQSLTNVSLLDGELFSFDFSDREITTNISTNCYNENATDNISVIYFIDNIIPNVTLNVSSNLINNTDYFIPNDDLNISLDCSDGNLYSCNGTIINLDTNTIVNNVFIEDINTTRYSVNLFNTTTQLWIGNFSLIGETTDSHTGKDLKKIWYVDSQENAFYGNIKFNCLNIQKMEIEDHYDKLKYKIKFQEERLEQICYYTGGTFKKVSTSDYPNHYIDIDQKIGIDDFGGTIEQINENTLKLIITSEIPFDKYKTESIFDLNVKKEEWFFEVVNTVSFLSKDLTINDFNTSSSSYVEVHREQLNISQTLNAVFLISMNIEKLGNPSESIVTGKVTVNGVTVKEEILRTVSTLNNIGSSGFSPFYYQLTPDQYNVSFFIKQESTAGSVHIDNIDFIIQEGLTNNGDNNIFNLTETQIIFSDTEFTNNYDFSFTQDKPSEVLHIFDVKGSATDESTIDFYLQNVNTLTRSPIISRYFSSSSSIGSMLLSVLDSDTSLKHNMSLYTKTNAEIITLNGTLINANFITNSSSVIKKSYLSNSSTNKTNFLELTAGNHKLVEIQHELYNSTELLIISFVSVNSSSGSQTPNIFINSSGGICASRERTLSSADDIGNIYLYTQCSGLTNGKIEDIELFISVPTGETVEVLDESLIVIETEQFNSNDFNIPPSFTITDNLPSTEAEDTNLDFSGLVIDLDSNNLSIKVEWFVNASSVKVETGQTINNANVTYSLANAFYGGSDLVNATITLNDGSDITTTITGTTLILDVTTDTELISDALSDLDNTLEKLVGGLEMIAFVILIGLTIGLALFTKYKLLLSASGGGMLWFSMFLGTRLVDQTTSIMANYYKYGVWAFMILGVLSIFMGVVLQLMETMEISLFDLPFSDGIRKKKDKFKNNKDFYRQY